MATKQKAAYKAGSKKAGSKKASKKASARKKPSLDGNDPPIIVSGGGGPDFPHVPGQRGPGKNKIEVEYSPEVGIGIAKHGTRVNGHTKITGVTISFDGMPGPPAPVTLEDYELYKIRIVFHTKS
ncbi:MAG: hypothetical protein QOJ64_3473 [Acidobacteriota bacterium]|nr:hypothetical protein [Acidobacteriota bacterium]